MNLNIIEDEIYLYTQHFFRDISAHLEDALAFIQDNNLTQPKENYTILVEYINTIYNHFSNLDYQVIEPIMIKLHRDMINLDSLYKEYDKKSSDIQEVFNRYILNHSEIFLALNKEMLPYKTLHNLSTEQKHLYKQKIEIMNQFQTIYYEKFEQIFIEEKKYHLSLIQQILNSRIYYLDTIIWIKIPMSRTIMSSLNLPKESLNSKGYISNKLSVILPYSQEYTYLKQCLRIFK